MTMYTYSIMLISNKQSFSHISLKNVANTANCIYGDRRERYIDL